jgi:hypothetical protein
MRRYGILLLSLAWVLIWAGFVDAAKIRFLSSVNADETGGSMSYPTGVACGEETILIADSGNGRLLHGTIVEDRTPLLKTVIYPQLQAPISVDRLSNGNYLVLDGKLRQIARIDGTTLAFQGFVELKDIAEANGAVIKAFALDATDQIYLLDAFNEQILVLDTSGQFVRLVKFPEQFGFMSDVSVDSSGTIYLVDSVNNQVLAAAPADKEFKILGAPQKDKPGFITGVSSSDTSLFLVDRRQGRIILVGFDGSILEHKFGTGFEQGQLRFPTALCLDSDNRLFVADQGNNRVQIFQIQQ